MNVLMFVFLLAVIRTLKFSVCPVNKHCPSSLCACAADVAMGKDFDVLVIGAVSLNHICKSKKVKLSPNRLWRPIGL
jgi:hypothetical protein